MASNTHEETKPDGAAFDDFFESLGKKAEHLSVNDKANGEPAAKDEFEATEDDDGEPKIVDEIESLCMNCHANVCLRQKSNEFPNYANNIR